MTSLEMDWRRNQREIARALGDMAQTWKKVINRLPHHIQMKYKLAIVRKQLENGKL